MTSVASVSSTAASVRVEDIRKLQTQVDQLKERLDFISPMLPLVNFVQDYFQKVECEASLQLLRLKNAQVMKQQDAEEEISNAQLETVKWLHFVTDAVTTLHGVSGASGGTGSGAMLGVQSAGGAAFPPTLQGLGSLSQDTSPTGIGGAAGGVGIISRADSGLLESRRPSAGSQQVTTAIFAAASSPTASSTRGSSGFMMQATTPSYINGTVGLEQQSSLSQRPEGDASGAGGRFLLSSSMQPTPVGSGSGGAAVSAAPTAGVRPGSLSLAPREPKGAGSDLLPASFEPLAEPGTGGTAGSGSEASMLDGLVLGRGSWAAAYRQAHGPRREALRLLCKSGIVTARELSDDLTVISQEHIDECVLIASEMLQTWPLDLWARQPEEAQKFFESRLTALYQRKFGEQKS
mmetsp:Transcript_102521/g.256888  ORF Transcript_102521/g.256888 Transcript_102521/m.256888 type:complete len:406 (+) Transcript_102521:429-1646(+)